MEIAYRIYPLPNGTVYTEEDVKTLDDVVGIFDYCQIMEAMISKNGWDYLIEKFGIEGLYEADKESGWFDSDSIEMFIWDIECEKKHLMMMLKTIRQLRIFVSQHIFREYEYETVNSDL